MHRRQVGRSGLVLGASAALAMSLLATPSANAAEARVSTGHTSAAGATTKTNTTANTAGESQLEWGPCPTNPLVGPLPPPMECTTVTVPLDYTKPDGATIDIAVSRLAIGNPAKRRGVLLTNPGGPGGPGLSMPLDLLNLGMPANVLDRYDIIGFDPRGIGASAPVTCGLTLEQGYDSNIPPYASNNAEVAAQAEIAKGVAKQCFDHDTAGTLRHMSTANTARDMDMIRAALGEEKISYYGISYGTVLGSAYVSMFPDRTDRVVLDSNVGDSALDVDGFRQFGLGAEDRFPDFAKYAAARNGTYGLGRTPAAVRDNFFKLVARLDQEPVLGMNGKMFRLQVFSGLYSDQSFPLVAQLWQALAESDTAAVRKAMDKSTSPGLPPVGAQVAAKPGAKAATPNPYDNPTSAQLAIICNDTEWPGDVATYKRNTRIDRARYPIMGGSSANILPCAYWPAPLEKKVEITDDGPSNILLLQNLRDPATPYVGGLAMRDRLGDRARLVSVDEGGHGVYLFNDNPCALNVTTKFLVDGKRPANDRFCAATSASGLRLTKAQEQLRSATLDRMRVN
ncbi:alpha/beta hydrolase [Actinopolymorpha pittospori]